jgi:hypothetical protein
MAEDQPKRGPSQEPVASKSTEASEVPEAATADTQEPPQATETPTTQQQEPIAAPQTTQAATLEALPENPLQADVSLE